MNMNPDLAAAIIRFLMAGKTLDKSVAEGHGNFYRKVTGTSHASLLKRRVVLSNDHHGIVTQSKGYGEAYVFFWAYLKSVETVNRVLLGAAGEVVVATVMSAAASSALGSTTVMSISGVRDTIAATHSPAARAAYSSGVMSGGQRVVSAMAAAAAAGTANDFAVSLDNFELAGACAITAAPDGDLVIWVNFSPSKSDMIRLMTSAANARGSRSYPGSDGNLAFVRAFASHGDAWTFDADTHKFEPVMKNNMRVSA